DGDAIAGAQPGDRPSLRRLGRDMADHEAVCRAGEAPVGDERDAVAQAPALDRGGDGEHLAHAGAADRPLATDDDDIARDDFTRGDGGEAGFLAVIDPGRPLEAQPRLAGELHDAALGRDIAIEHAIAAAR